MIKNKKGINYIFNALLILSVFMMGLQYTEYSFLSRSSLVGPFALLVLFSVYYLIINRQLIISKNSLIIFVTTTLFFMFYIFNVNNQFQLKIDYLLFLGVIYIIFLLISLFKNNIIIYPMWSIFVAVYASLYIPRLFADFQLLNSHGTIAFLLMFFSLVNFKQSNIYLKFINIYSLVILLAIIFNSNSRNTLIALVSVIALYLLYAVVKKHMSSTILFVILFGLSVTIFYIKMMDTELGVHLNNLSLKYTNKNFYPGREDAWIGSFYQVMNSNRILTGSGNNMKYELFNGYLHNLYVQIFFQSGIVGLIFFISLLLGIVIVIRKTKAQINDYNFKVLFIFFNGVLMLQIFEGFLITSYAGISIITVLCWLIIALFVNNMLMSSNSG